MRPFLFRIHSSKIYTLSRSYPNLITASKIIKLEMTLTKSRLAHKTLLKTALLEEYACPYLSVREINRMGKLIRSRNRTVLLG